MFTKRKKYYIEVTGSFSPRHSTPEGVVKDMLRYDSGMILGEVKLWDFEGLVSPGRMRGFTMLVQSEQYTLGRWNSFGLKTKEVGEK